ncbi:ATP-dependent RNA helicase RhlE [Desulfoluna limicola]|uniref:ATP-dependent RNA helicase RhlE n=1 Tax=Desulfoluna limicola TaxID=2810562 RepID=A0ABM7PHU9_9BACT|nr:DEAD/DEAH box helicase [Desulfoluna limicola]BCS96715.1 ATP-dependent RNA helicase RhlE [Desulfoluna limicola]
MSFDQLGLRAELLKAVETKGYTTPTPIQSKAIPVILDGRDIFARAQTGTGKTDAFGLPLVEILSRGKSNGRHPRALVLTPTRELALQVGESIKALARRVSLRCTVVHGGVRIQPQIDRLKRGVDILVATPGRLLDLASLRHLNLLQIEFVVFDEADRMLDLGFNEEITEVINLMPYERRTMLFSATYTQEIRDLAAKMLRDPEHIEVTPKKTAAESVIQKVHLVEKTNKRPLLVHLITSGRWSRVLVFCRTKHGANKLTDKLTDHGISAAALHGNKSQSLRTRTLEEFKRGEIRILVATDVAARGLDISNLPFVVNYDMPSIPEDYVHRIGRTGRAGVSGIAVSLVSAEEKRFLDAIEALLKHKIPVEKVDGYTQGHDVPDFVLFRPGSTGGGKKVDKELQEIVEQRKESKQKSNTRKGKSKSSGKGPKAASKAGAKPGSKPRAGKKTGDAGKKPSRPASRSSQPSRPGKPRGRR